MQKMLLENKWFDPPTLSVLILPKVLTDIITRKTKNFCYFSRGSIIETKSWLKKAQTRNLINDDIYQVLIQQLETIHHKLNIYIKYIGKVNIGMTQ